MRRTHAEMFSSRKVSA